MNFRSEFGLASGRNKSDCHFIAYRFEKDATDAQIGESRVMSAAEGTVHSLWLRAGWLTGLWRSDAGHVYVSDIAGGVHMSADGDPTAREYTYATLSGAIAGVWGACDEHVWAWGETTSQPVLHFWNGTTWREVEAPFAIVAMHGPHPELVVAIGRDGSIARWDGKSWQRLRSPPLRTLSDVFVVSEDEIYASTLEGELLQGSASECSSLLRSDQPIQCVAKAYGIVWVGTARGLMKVAGETLVDVKPNVRARRFQAGDSLLICAPDLIAHTIDGANFVGTKIGVVDALAGPTPLVGT